MLYQCPACTRPFPEPGFCPYDRSPLVTAQSTADKQTMLSVAMPAVAPHSVDPEAAASHKTALEQRRGTFPLTPSTAGGPHHAPTQEITSTHARAVPSNSDAPKIRHMSASDSTADALEAYRTPRDNEYDKLVGQTLDGRYYVVKKIGEGGMGVVFSARHSVIERPLAIKVLKREVMRDAATIRRFVQEAKAASRIGHPNIVDVTDFGTTPDGMTYSVMEFVDGQTLGAAIRNSAPFPPLRAVKIAAQVARALGAAHDKGIVHRDLKPENVFLLDRDGRTDFVKIVDFGIAKVAPVPGSAAEPRLTRAGSVFGTPEYMAPEQAAGRSDTDGRADIYALGVILYEMICGKVPHRGDSMVRTLAMQMLDPAEPPSKVRPDLNIPPELELVVMTSLEKKREQRYQTMGEFLDALEKVHTVIGQSITGSPVYALAPLPPGADLPHGPGSPHLELPIAGAHSPIPSRSHSPTGRRLKNEPEFTASEKPHTFEHVLDDTDAPRRRSAWPLFVMFLLIAGGATTAVLLMMKRNARSPATADAGVAITTPERDAASAPDAAVVAMIQPDAAVELMGADAGVVDASDDIVVVRSDAGMGRIRRDAATNVLPDTPNHRGTIMIQVLTKPEGANLYAGNTYRGPGGTQIEEPLGSKLDLRCHQQGYKDGKVQLVFDGKTEVVLCALVRIKLCINNIKNPFDDCELDPTKPSVPVP